MQSGSTSIYCCVDQIPHHANVQLGSENDRADKLKDALEFLDSLVKSKFLLARLFSIVSSAGSTIKNAHQLPRTAISGCA